MIPWRERVACVAGRTWKRREGVRRSLARALERAEQDSLSVERKETERYADRATSRGRGEGPPLEADLPKDPNFFAQFLLTSSSSSSFLLFQDSGQDPESVLRWKRPTPLKAGPSLPRKSWTSSGTRYGTRLRFPAPLPRGIVRPFPRDPTPLSFCFCSPRLLVFCVHR